METLLAPSFLRNTAIILVICCAIVAFIIFVDWSTQRFKAATLSSLSEESGTIGANPLYVWFAILLIVSMLLLFATEIANNIAEGAALSGEQAAVIMFSPFVFVNVARHLGRSSKISWYAAGIEGPRFGWLIRPRPVFIAWADIKGIGENFGGFRILGDGGKVIGLDHRYVGASYLLAALRRHRPDLKVADRLGMKW